MLAAGCSCSFGPYPITDHMTYWERHESLGEDSYNCYGGIDSQLSYFDYDDPMDYEEWCAWNDVDEEEGYYAHFPRMWGTWSFLGRTRMLLLLLRLSVKRGMRIFMSRRGWAWLETYGMPLLSHEELMDVPDLWSSVVAGQMGTSPVLEDTSDSPVPVVVSGLDLPDPELGVMLSLQDVLNKTVPGPGDFFPESGCFSTGPAFVGALLPGLGGPSPELEGPRAEGLMWSPRRLCTISGKHSPGSENMLIWPDLVYDLRRTRTWTVGIWRHLFRESGAAGVAY